MSFRPAGERLAAFLRTPAGEALLVSGIATTMGIAPQMIFGPQQDAGNYAAQTLLGLPAGMLAGMAGRRVGGHGLRGDLAAHSLAEVGVLAGMMGGSKLEDELTEPPEGDPQDAAQQQQQKHLGRQQAQLESRS